MGLHIIHTESVAKCIEKCLIEHGHCVVEGLGTFYVVKVPAKIIHNGTQLIPPRSALRFNSKIRSADPALALLLSSTLKISAEEANRYVSLWTNQIQTWLSWKKQARVAGLGTLISDEQGNVFLDNQEFSHPSDLGKNRLILKTLEKSADEKNNINPKLDTTPIYTAEADKKTTEEFSSKKEVILKIPAILKVAAILIPFVILFWWIYYTTERLNGGQQVYLASLFYDGHLAPSYNASGSPLPSDEIRYFHYSRSGMVFGPDGIARPEVDGVSLIIKNQAFATKDFSENHPLPAKTFATTPHQESKDRIVGNFLIIAGSFSVSENAERFMNKLNRLGLAAFIAGKNPKGLTMIAAASCATRDEAEEQLGKVRKEIPNAWILKK